MNKDGEIVLILKYFSSIELYGRNDFCRILIIYYGFYVNYYGKEDFY